MSLIDKDKDNIVEISDREDWGRTNYFGKNWKR
jgi:hypothetical protein